MKNVTYRGRAIVFFYYIYIFYSSFQWVRSSMHIYIGPGNMTPCCGCGALLLRLTPNLNRCLGQMMKKVLLFNFPRIAASYIYKKTDIIN